MTEQEWKTVSRFDGSLRLEMFGFIRRRMSKRQMRLFACSSLRRLLSDNNRPLAELLTVNEQYADGSSGWNALSAARKRAQQLVEEAMLGRLPGYGAGFVGWFRAVAHPDIDQAIQSALHWCDPDSLREIVGNPFHPVTLNPNCLTPTVQTLALAIYHARSFEKLPILADALEEAGCTQEDVLSHLRSGGEHVRGCWAVDLVLGKE